MAMSQVQFQAGLSMAQFILRYGTEAKCYRALYRARWPRGFRCPRCDSRPRSRFRRAGRIYYQCRACRHQTTLTSGTVFEGSKLPLTTWFLAMHLLTGSKTNMSALELKRHLGVCYDSAWKLKHKIMQVMTEREEPRQLTGFVQIDDAYLGGERNGGKPGRGSENKQSFVVAVPPTKHGNIRPSPSSSRSAASITPRSPTGASDALHPMPKSSATGWDASGVWSN